MTLDGTNSYFVATSGGWSLVDPGPRSEAHLRVLCDTASSLGGQVQAVVTTHAHSDHRELAPDVAIALGAPLLEAAELLEEPRARDFLERCGLAVIPTPGHSSDSVCFLSSDHALLTGDLVLGRGTTAVLYPDGSLGDYLESLARAQALSFGVLAPGHGPVLEEALARQVIEYYRVHRLERLDQLRGLVAQGPHSVDALVEIVYGNLEDRVLAWSARASTMAAIAYLVERGELLLDADLVTLATSAHRDPPGGAEPGTSASSVS